LIGFGHVGRRLAEKISGFNVKLLIYDPYVGAETIESYGGEKVSKRWRKLPPHQASMAFM